MYYIGLDIASRSSFVYVVDGRGKKIESKEIPTYKDGYRQYFGEWAKKAVYVAVEAGGHTRWIHDTITKFGINVYVVNPHKGKLIAKSKKKTDKIDAKILAELLRMDGLPRRVHVDTGDSYPDSAGSQFFICVKDYPFLDRQYTVFGEVVSDMEVADKIVSQPRDQNDNPNDRIEMTVKIVEGNPTR